MQQSARETCVRFAEAPNVLSLSALSQLGGASVVATKRELAMYMAQVKFYLDSIAVPARFLSALSCFAA